MGQIARKPSLHVVEPTSVKIYSSYQEAMVRRYDVKKAMLIEWIRYNCDSNQSKGLRYSVYHTQKNLCASFNCSRSTLNLWLKELREDRIIAVGKDYNHNCRQNDYSIGPGYFEIVGAGDASEYEYRTFFAKKQEPAKASSASSVSNIKDIVCQETGHSVSDNRTPNSKIYNIHKTKNKTYSSGSARGEPFPDPSPAPEDVFFVSEKIKAQEAPPAPPPADPEPAYQPIPTPPQPQPLHAQELSKDEKREAREAYAKFVETYPRKSGTEKELKEAFLGPLRELGAEELLFRVEKYIEMFEKKGKSKDFYLGDTNFLIKKGYKSDELMDFIASTPRYRVLHAPVEPEIPLSKEEREYQKKIKAVDEEIRETEQELEVDFNEKRSNLLWRTAVPARNEKERLKVEEEENKKKDIMEKYKDQYIKILEEGNNAWSKDYQIMGLKGYVLSTGLETFAKEQYLIDHNLDSEFDWINDHPKMKALQEKKRCIEAREEFIEEEPTEIEKTKPQEAAGSQVFVKVPNTGGLLKRMP